LAYSPLEFMGSGSSVPATVGTSSVVLADGESEGFTEEATVEEGRSDSDRDDDNSEGVGVGVAEDLRDASSWDEGEGVGDCSEGLSSCRRTAVYGAAATNCRHKAIAKQIIR
jgi:hypothetical protein